jgi:ribosomal protein S10
MTQACLFTIKSKNKKSMFNFLSFFKDVSKQKMKSRIQKKRLQKKNYKRITLLKSPHVHKSAQTQFECRIYKTEISIALSNTVNFLILMKKLLNRSFYDIKITLNFFFKGEGKQKPVLISLTDFYFNHRKKYSNNLIANDDYGNLWHVKKFKTYQFASMLRTAGAALRVKV